LLTCFTVGTEEATIAIETLHNGTPECMFRVTARKVEVTLPHHHAMMMYMEHGNKGLYILDMGHIILYTLHWSVGGPLTHSEYDSEVKYHCPYELCNFPNTDCMCHKTMTAFCV
jgi:hypothetical protein